MHSAPFAALLAASALVCATSADATTIIRKIDFDFPATSGAPGGSFFGSVTLEMTEGLTTPGGLPVLGPTPDFHLLQADISVIPPGGGAAIGLVSSLSEVPELTYRAVDGRLVYVMLQLDTSVPGGFGQPGDWSLSFSAPPTDPSKDVLTGEFSAGYEPTYSYCYGAYATYFEGYAFGREYCVFDPSDIAVSEPAPSVGQVPVPGALPLLGLGLLGIAALRRRG